MLFRSGVSALEEKYQEDFDNNKSYLGFGLIFDGDIEQGDDMEREAQAIAEQLQLDLECVVHDYWLSHLTRDEVISLCKELKKTSKKFTLCQGAEYSADEIIFDWNDIFPIFPIFKEDIL